MDSTALLLMGGGSRAAYQAGVLRGIARLARECAPDAVGSPFDVICGTSAGAINGVGLARGAQDFLQATEALVQLWAKLHADRVYRTDVGRVGASGARWLTALAFGWMTGRTPRALFDNTPLRELLLEQHDAQQLQAAFDAGALRALAVTALSYTTGRHVTFYQSPHVVLPWRRSQRIAVTDTIGVPHLLASSSIPFLFPAEPVQLEGNDEWFGDGTMRQMSPLSPAIHLGASRILVVGRPRASSRGGTTRCRHRATRRWRRWRGRRWRACSSTGCRPTSSGCSTSTPWSAATPRSPMRATDGARSKCW